MMRDDFAAFILTHQRPDNVRTLAALENGGYSGRWYLVLDDEDKTASEYRQRYGAERVLLFSKNDADTDMADNGGTRAAVVYARNAVDGLAQELGLSYYVQLDDDYPAFSYRFVRDGELKQIRTHYLDEVFSAFVDFLDDSDALTVAMSQCGDYLGGYDRNFFRDCLSRKAMNTFFARVGRPIRFVGRINEDVNTYVSRGARGDLFLTVADFCINQAETQHQTGGMAAAYVDGTYRKSFYPLLFAPSAVKVYAMTSTHGRIHHRINWDNAVPKIISSRYRKSELSHV